MNLDISIMLVGSSVFAASFMLLNWMVWLWIEILIGETLELTLSAVDIYIDLSCCTWVFAVKWIFLEIFGRG